MMTSHKIVRLVGLALVGLLSSLAAPAALAAPPVWTMHGSVAEGSQFDAVRGPDDRIHLVSSRYYELDGDLNVLVDEGHGDGAQGALDFPPALAVADDGTAHIITRHGGTRTTRSSVPTITPGRCRATAPSLPHAGTSITARKVISGSLPA